MSNIDLSTDINSGFLTILRHLFSCWSHYSKETLFDIRQPNMLFICLPEGSDIPHHVEQIKKQGTKPCFLLSLDTHLICSKLKYVYE